jgi:SH3 domain-containing YSC84-like protein 1
MRMRQHLYPIASILFSYLIALSAPSWAADANTGVAKRSRDAAQALAQIMSDQKNAIPQNVLKTAKCIAVIPSMMQAAVVVGGNHGKGLVTCRTGKGWSAPAPIDITGGSWGAQVGGEAVDLVLVVTNDEGMQQLLSSKMKFGTETAAVAGNASEHAGVSSDPDMKTDVLTYSRAHGAFVGTNFNGASISQDTDDTRAMYGSDMGFSDILGGKAPTPDSGQPFMQAVKKYTAQAARPG